MKTFSEFVAEAYDKDVMGSSQIRKQGEGGRVGANRKKTEPEKRRMKAAGGGKMVPAKDYKPRKDIGSQRQRSTREQQPTQERGSAALSAKEAQRKAYRERKARESGAKTKSASELLSKKSAKKVNPNYKPQKASGYTRTERQKLQRTGDRIIRDIRKGKDKPASAYQN
jgi:glucan-binding YG repeat protein